MTNEEVIEKFSDLVHFLALSRTNQPSDADDVYQEVFFRYIRKKPTFQDEEHAKAWFIKVTMNITKSMNKAAARQQMMTAYAGYANADDGESETAAEHEPSDEDFAEAVERQADFEGRLSELNPRYRVVLLLRFDCGYSIREIAKLMGESEDVTKALLTRAKRQYRNLVMKGENDDGRTEIAR